MNRLCARLALAAALVVACAAQDAGRDAAPSMSAATWRGDVAYPGLPAIGVRFDVDGERPWLVAAPNMGFGGGPLHRFEMDDESATFRWSLNDDLYDCTLRRQPDGTYQGPCTSPPEPTIGMRMVPPGVDAPTGLKRSMLEMSSVQWVVIDSGVDGGRTTIRAATQNRERVDLASVRADIARARADNAALFGDDANVPVDVFLVGDRSLMSAAIGRAAGGWTDPMAATVALVGLGENSVALRHELTHAIAFNAWGPPRDGAPWLAEGLATWVAGDCAGQPIHDLARDRRARSESIPLRDLLHDFARQNDIVSYLQSGSLIGYILATYGADALEHVWRDGEDGLHAIGVDEARLERDWLRFIDARPAARMDWTAIREHGCG